MNPGKRAPPHLTVFGVGVLWPSAKQISGMVVNGPVDLLVKVEPDRYHVSRLEMSTHDFVT